MMLTSSPRERAGAAGGMLGTARLTGQTLGAVLTAIFLHLFGPPGEVIGLWVGRRFRGRGRGGQPVANRSQVDGDSLQRRRVSLRASGLCATQRSRSVCW